MKEFGINLQSYGHRSLKIRALMCGKECESEQQWLSAHLCPRDGSVLSVNKPKVIVSGTVHREKQKNKRGCKENSTSLRLDMMTPFCHMYEFFHLEKKVV